MIAPASCDDCLRRAVLVAHLAPLIEVIAVDKPGRRSGELLALPDEELGAAVARGEGPELVAEAGGRDLGELRAAMQAGSLWAACMHDPLFPKDLLGDPQAPLVLFGAGDFGLLPEIGAETATTIVGSRRASAYGGDMAQALAADLAAAGLLVISGMALGIDSRAHEGALGAGGRTVAVLGSGPDHVHPASNLGLYRRIVESGLVMSELPPGTRPYRWTFPARNRIMAALAGMTVVVEAAVRSGSLITATMAIDYGRDVGAVPGDVGRPLTEGTNGLLADGAIVVRDAQDVLDAMLGAGAPRVASVAAPLSCEQEEILGLIGRGHDTADAIAAASGAGVGESAAALTGLELIGAIRCDESGRYRPVPPSPS